MDFQHIVKPIYVVSGMHRSGTSAMMGALVNGGIAGNYQQHIETNLIQAERLRVMGGVSEYHPNPKGFFEGRIKPLSEARGMVSKGMLQRFFYHDPAKLPKAPVWVIIMRRPEDERRRSLEKWNYTEQELGVRLDFDKYYAMYEEHMDHARTWHIQYHDLVYHPRAIAEMLQGEGWPITNVEGFCDHIDPALHRNK